ncbi:unnamed protein product [Prorocentrum cordatum]|uniref:DNA topoisomerase n=1 Tax=Prorocentrum cordatum TaxID=2364126 RepID=A0ABN9SZ74_9DINO|nr:unnamed protein product [Polarella glacialis]
MEEHGVGTDATMAHHISNVISRSYVKLDKDYDTRKLAPTGLGLALIHAYTLIDPGLVQPTVRAAIENAVNRVATGHAQKHEVVQQAVQIFQKKFQDRLFKGRADRVPMMLAMAYTKDRKAVQGKAANVLAQWDYAQKHMAAIQLEHLLGARGGVSLQETPTRRRRRWPPASACGSTGSKEAAPQLNDMMAVVDHLNAENGRWHVRMVSGEVKALKPDNLSPVVNPFSPGYVVCVHGLTGAKELNGKEGICQNWDASAGRWKVKLILDDKEDIRNVKPENLHAAESWGPAAEKAKVLYREELEALGFTSGAGGAPMMKPAGTWQQDSYSMRRGRSSAWEEWEDKEEANKDEQKPKGTWAEEDWEKWDKWDDDAGGDEKKRKWNNDWTDSEWSDWKDKKQKDPEWQDWGGGGGEAGEKKAEWKSPQKPQWEQGGQADHSPQVMKPPPKVVQPPARPPKPPEPEAPLSEVEKKAAQLGMTPEAYMRLAAAGAALGRHPPGTTPLPPKAPAPPPPGNWHQDRPAGDPDPSDWDDRGQQQNGWDDRGRGRRDDHGPQGEWQEDRGRGRRDDWDDRRRDDRRDDRRDAGRDRRDERRDADPNHMPLGDRGRQEERGGRTTAAAGTTGTSGTTAGGERTSRTAGAGTRGTTAGAGAVTSGTSATAAAEAGGTTAAAEAAATTAATTGGAGTTAETSAGTGGTIAGTRTRTTCR